MIFEDTNQLIKLEAEFILIIGGGSLKIGEEEKPYQGTAEILMHGHQQSIELPMYGAKTLAVREGTVEMHGKPVTPTWCDLGETVEAGSVVSFIMLCWIP